jgi:hypothetical protein
MNSVPSSLLTTKDADVESTENGARHMPVATSSRNPRGMAVLTFSLLDITQGRSITGAVKGVRIHILRLLLESILLYVFRKDFETRLPKKKETRHTIAIAPAQEQ